MYIARFSCEVLPINRRQAVDFIHREVEAAARVPLNARLLVPLTRAHEAASLQLEVELDTPAKLRRAPPPCDGARRYIGLAAHFLSLLK
jgi:hypothetical protein